MYSNRSVAFPWEPNHRLYPAGPGGPGGPGGPWKTRLLYSLTMSCSTPRAANDRKHVDVSERFFAPCCIQPCENNLNFQTGRKFYGLFYLMAFFPIIKVHRAHINIHLMYSTTSTTFSRELTHWPCPGTPGSPGGPGGP